MNPPKENVITDSATLDMAPHRHHIAEKMIGIPQEIEKFGRNFTKFKGKPKEAIAHLIKIKNGQVRGAINKEGIGDIDFIWGKVLNHKKHTGYGLAHIIDKHGVESAYEMPEMIRKLDIKRESGNGIILEDDEQRVSIRLDWIGKSKIWVLTAFNKREAGDNKAVSDAIAPMHLMPTHTCHKVGAASLNNTIPPNDKNVNTYSIQGNSMNLVQQIYEAVGLDKIKLIREYESLDPLKKIKLLREHNGQTEEKAVAKEINKNFDETIQKRVEEGTQRTLSFSTPDEADAFAVAFSRAIHKGHTVHGASVTVSNLTSEDNEWIDQYMNLTDEDLKAIDDFVKSIDHEKEIQLSDVIYALQRIEETLENPDSTHDDYKALEKYIDRVEANEDIMEDNETYKRVIALLEDAISDDADMDSIAGNLFADIDMDSIKKYRRFMTYGAWKRAVKELDKDADFTGDEDIDGAWKKDWYDAEWDGAEGEIRMLERD